MARVEKPYLIYTAESPSGRRYVGITGTSLKRRWAAHVRRAVSGAIHPLASAIRKYGAENFGLAVLEVVADKATAQRRERFWIECLRANGPDGYNISPGGEADGEVGAARLKELMLDPEWRANHLAKLREACRGRQPIHLPAAAEAWREMNVREAWRIARRASRIAAAGRARPDPRFGAWGRLRIDSTKVATARRSHFARLKAIGQWGRRTKADTAALGAKIGRSLKAHHARHPERVAASIATARRHIDKRHQAERASAGLKRWWAELRADPERYRRYLEQRASTRRRNRAS
ncbi:MAG: GIY-YIG nuclease family protein [Hyphomicrobiaceae bacterium]|nr:GIY-YIG nuclease family protein [Hyphomicrobiaceae bacterium]